MKNTLSVIIPIYNEEGNIRLLFDELSQTLNSLIKDKTLLDYEIIFINDGSCDKTQLVLEEFRETIFPTC